MYLPQGTCINLAPLRLDGLPFPPDYFDFVRIAGLGLAVPEDEVSARHPHHMTDLTTQ